MVSVPGWKVFGVFSGMIMPFQIPSPKTKNYEQETKEFKTNNKMSIANCPGLEPQFYNFLDQ